MTHPQDTFTSATYNDVYDYISPSGRLAGGFDGKRILITGGGRGIGKAMTHAFALAGASQIHIAGRTASQLAETQAAVAAAVSGVEIFTHTVDVTDRVSIGELFAGLPSPPDVLVNNAGRMEDCIAVGNSDIDDWWATQETNIKGVYLVTREYLRTAAAKGGVIITTSSIGALVTVPELSAYQISKTAVNRFTEFVQTEYGDKGFRAVTFHPGGIKTELAGKLPKGMEVLLVDEPGLSGATTVWLASGEAAFLGGRYVSAHWDMEEVVRRQKEIVEKDLLKLRLVLS